MSFNDADVAPYLDAEFVRVCVLFKIELLSETLFYALQNVPLTDNNAQTWQPANSSVISYEDFPLAVNAAAQKRTYTLAVPDLALANRMIADEAEYRGRLLTQFLQIFTDDWVPISTPKFLHVGIMDVATSKIKAGGVAVFTLACESLFATKDRSTYGLLTDTEQRQRHPLPVPDAGLDRVKELQRGVVIPYPPS